MKLTVRNHEVVRMQTIWTSSKKQQGWKG